MLHVLHQKVNVPFVLLQSHHIDDKRMFHLTEKAKLVPQVLLLLRLEYFLLGYDFNGTNFVSREWIDVPVGAVLTPQLCQLA